MILAEEFDKVSYITIDKDKFEQPQSKYQHQQITITGYVADYGRGEKVSIDIISPSKSQEEIVTYASKKGNLYTVIRFDADSQIGIHTISLKYHNVEIATTSFEILENQ